MNSCGLLASHRTFAIGISPGYTASRIWHATAPDAVSSILEMFMANVSLIHPTMAFRPTKYAGSIMPAVGGKGGAEWVGRGVARRYCYEVISKPPTSRTNGAARHVDRRRV